MWKISQKNLEIWKSANLDICESGHLRIWKFGSLEIESVLHVAVKDLKLQVLSFRPRTPCRHGC